MAPSRILLRNRVYLGELNHKGSSHPGQHEPIIAPALFDAVQKKLTANRNGSRIQRAASGALLLGRIFDDRWNRMTPSTAKKGELRYRYYVSSVLAQGRQSEAGSVRRVSALEIESFIVQALRTVYPDDADLDERALIQARIDRIILRRDSIDMHQTSDPGVPMQLAWLPSSTARKREILRPSDANGDERGIKAEARTVLLRSIALARRWLDQTLGGSTLDEIAVRERCTKRHVSNTIPLAFLAPDLVRAVIHARLPRGISTKRIAEPALEWSRQWEMLGIRP